MYLLQGDYKKVKSYCNDQFAEGYFEFEFPYVSEDERFKEIDRFLWESRHECTRYKNRYTGSFIIGLNEWNENAPNKYFEAFMYFLKDQLRLAKSCIFYIEDRAKPSLLTVLENYFDITLKELSLTPKKAKSQIKIGFCIESVEKEKNHVRTEI